MSLEYILVLVLVWYLIFYLVGTLQIDAGVKRIIHTVITIFAIIALLSFAGAIPGLQFGPRTHTVVVQ